MSVYYCYQQVKQRNVTVIIISIFPQAVTTTVKQSAPQINHCRTVRPLMEIRYKWDVVADESGQHNMSNNSSQYGEDGDTCSNSPICPSIVILATVCHWLESLPMEPFLPPSFGQGAYTNPSLWDLQLLRWQIFFI